MRLVAVLTLALGVGANATLFTLLDPILLRPLPYAQPHSLVRLYRTSVQSNSWPHSPPAFLDYQTLNQSFESLACFIWTSFNLASPGEAAERAQGLAVNGDFFRVLGVQPALGRVFTEEDDKPGVQPVMVLSYRFWASRFGGDPHVLERSFQLNGREAKVVGVMPDSFENPLLFDRVDLWRPIAFTDAQRQNRGNNYLNIVGRLKQGITAAQAESQMRALAARLDREHGRAQLGESLRIENFKRSITPEATTQVSWFMFALTMFVLLIACVNLANLQLARTTARTREFALRAALGGGRGRLIRQCLIDSVIISLLGGAAALLPSIWSAQAVARRAFTWSQNAYVAFDYRFFAFAFLCSVLAGIVCGVLPAWIASRANLSHALKNDLRTGRASASHRRVRHALITAEIAFALVLLGGTGTFVRALREIVNVDPGWNADGLLVGRIGLDGPNYANPPQQAEFLNRLHQRLAALPGVHSAALSLSSPASLFSATTEGAIEGREDTRLFLNQEMVSPQYFETLGIPIRQGRSFTSDDRFGRTEVVIINETMARRYWPDESPVGKRVDYFGSTDHHWKTIIGVAGDVRFPSALIQPDSDLTIYRPIAQAPIRGARVELRVAGAPEALIPAVRELAQELDKDMPVFDLRTARSLIQENVAAFNLGGMLLIAFAVLGLVLSAVGIYGVISYLVTQRTGEIGLRMALGAQRNQVRWLVLRQGLVITGIGVAIGLVGTVAATRALSIAVPGLPASNPLVIDAMTASLSVIALLACALPARRASAIDPIDALRHE